MKIQGIYKIVNKINNKIYIGQTKDIIKRFTRHKSNVVNKINHTLYDSMRCYGIENFEFIIIEKIENINKLNEREQYWIDYYKSYDRNYGYNLRLKAESNRGYKHSEKSKINMSLAKQKNPSWLGKKHTKESRDKIAKAHKGKKLTKIHKLNIAKSLIGKKRRPHSKEAKLKMSISHKGKPNINKNISISKEQKEKIKHTFFKKDHIPWNKGKTVSEKTRLKMRLAKIGKKRKPYKKV